MKRTANRSNTARIWVLFQRLNPAEKMKVVARLEKETREKRWDALTEKLSRRFEENPISDEEITKLVEEVRQSRYERSQNRS